MQYLEAMKRIVAIAIFFSLLCAGFVSCEKAQPEAAEDGSLQLQVEPLSLIEGQVLASGFLSLHNADNSIVLVNEKIGIYKSDSIFISQPIQLPAGQYFIDGFVAADSKSRITLISPKIGSKGALVSGRSLPAQVAVGAQTSRLKIAAIPPHFGGLLLKDFGYQDLGGNVPDPLPWVEPRAMICLRVGVPEGFPLLEAVKFKILADDSLVLSGVCSKGISSFELPLADTKYEILTLYKDGFSSQVFAVQEASRFRCGSEDFINLMHWKTKPDNHLEIRYIKQELSIGGGADLSIIDSAGNVFQAWSEEGLPNNLDKAVFPISDEEYEALEQLMFAKIGTVSSIKLDYFHSLLPEIEKSLISSYIPKGRPAPVCLYAISKTADGQHKAVLIDAGGPPNGTDWGKDPKPYLPLNWLMEEHFYVPTAIPLLPAEPRQ